MLLLPQRVSDVRAQNLRFTLSYRETKSLISPLGHTLAVMEADNGIDKTLGDRLGNAQAKALTSALVTTPFNVEKKTFADTMTDAADETEVHTLAVKLPELVADTVAIYYAKSRPIEWSMTC